MSLILTKNQLEALNLIAEWFNTDSKLFKLSGSAGTGKSTLLSFLKEVLDIADNEIVFATFTGKASLVLNNKGVNAVTIHKLIYDFINNIDNKPTFKLKTVLDKDYKLIVIDEASFISEQVLYDLLSFNTKVILVGDKNQLPPIKSKSIFESANYHLSEIIRQQEGNPIINLSQRILNDELVFKYQIIKNKIAVAPKSSMDINSLIRADQVIVGTNKERNRINNLIREHLGHYSTYPEQGDKVICTQNRWDILIDDVPLVNGMIGYVKEIRDTADDYFMMRFNPEFTEESKWVRVSKLIFNDEEDVNPNNCKFDFGYAITLHKAQGSEFNKVVLINPYFPKGNKDYHKRWLYTGVTRAKDSLIIYQ